jgi:uncharacterized protein YjbI with pentapeptide repeats
MSPEVIAGAVGIVTAAATVIVQIVGFRATKANTEQQIKATHKDTADTLGQQSKHLDKTLAEQRGQLDRTLQAQSEQLDKTLAEQRTRTLNERFATAADQLGSDKPAVRLAGVYAMAGLADDWTKNRQTCVDVLCAYLRMPYEPDPGQDAPVPQRLAFQAIREVRHTVIRIITAHLKKDKDDPTSWQSLDFDFTGVVFDGGDFSGAQFSGGRVDFTDAQFSGGDIDFTEAQFSGSKVDFTDAQFSGGMVYFTGAQFSDGTVRFYGTNFSPGAKVVFYGAQFSRDEAVDFRLAHFSGGKVDFTDATWSFPPQFPWKGTPPRGVKLSREEDQSEA